MYAVSTQRFIGDRRPAGDLKSSRSRWSTDAGGSTSSGPGSEFTLPCELALLAMGFLGPERAGMIAELGVKLTERGNVRRDETG